MKKELDELEFGSLAPHSQLFDDGRRLACRGWTAYQEAARHESSELSVISVARHSLMCAPPPVRPVRQRSELFFELQLI